MKLSQGESRVLGALLFAWAMRHLEWQKFSASMSNDASNISDPERWYRAAIGHLKADRRYQ